MTATTIHSGLDAAGLDATLGDPWDAANPYGLAAGVARDAAAEYPAGFARRLHEIGFHLNYLPAGLGGTLRSLEDTHVLVRAAARRDLNVMPATMFSISAVLTVLAIGTTEQQETVAGWVRAGRVVAFALSEEHAGSDVLANTCRLSTVDGGGHRLDGTKWLVGRGVSADAAVVLARTGERPGPGAFTAVLIGDLSGVVREPVPMSGMRGMDFADLTFNGFPVPESAVVGRVGQGLEGAMRAQQVVRLMSTAGCLSTVDTALRVARTFARGRSVGGSTVAQTPYGRRELALAAAETLAADVTALAACRLLHADPQRFGLASAVVKRIGTELTASAIARCGSILGARAVLRGGGPGAIWDKAARDNAMVKVIDTSPVGNLRALAMQLPAYAAVQPQVSGGLSAAFRFGADLPGLDPAALDLSPRPRDEVVPGFRALAPRIADALSEQGDPGTAALIHRAAGQLEATLQDAAAAQLDRTRGLKVATDLLDLADRFCLLYAAGCAALAWWFNRDRALYGSCCEQGTGWLTGTLAYLTARVAGEQPGSAVLPALDCVEGMAATGLLFTALPVRLAEAPPTRSNGDAR
jgi:alkylation response protein AidB-like acyl-CoA dehydrogenase